MTATIEKEKCASEPRICQPLKACPQKAITWVEDPEFDRAIQDMSKVDPELWK